MVESVGLTVKKVLQRSDPYEEMRCGRNDCPVSKHGRSRGCSFQIVCKEDSRKYGGQTGRSVYERVKEETRDWRKEVGKSPLWRHSQSFHQGEDICVEVKVVDKSFGKSSRRLITDD